MISLPQSLVVPLSVGGPFAKSDITPGSASGKEEEERAHDLHFPHFLLPTSHSPSGKERALTATDQEIYFHPPLSPKIEPLVEKKGLNIMVIGFFLESWDWFGFEKNPRLFWLCRWIEFKLNKHNLFLEGNVIFRNATKIFEPVMDFWLRLNTNWPSWSYHGLLWQAGIRIFCSR